MGLVRGESKGRTVSACLQTIASVELTRFAALPGSSQPSFRTGWRYDVTTLNG